MRRWRNSTSARRRRRRSLLDRRQHHGCFGEELRAILLNKPGRRRANAHHDVRRTARVKRPQMVDKWSFRSRVVKPCRQQIVLLKFQRPRRLLLEFGPDGASKCAPRQKVAPERVQHQHTFGFAARLAACWSGQYSRQDQQADAETSSQRWPARIDRCGRDASAHPLTLAVRTAAFQHISSASARQPTASAGSDYDVSSAS